MTTAPRNYLPNRLPNRLPINALQRRVADAEALAQWERALLQQALADQAAADERARFAKALAPHQHQHHQHQHHQQADQARRAMAVYDPSDDTQAAQADKTQLRRILLGLAFFWLCVSLPLVWLSVRN